MTVDNTFGGGTPAVVPFVDDDSLADFGVADAVMPRISISHKEGVFINAMTEERYEALDAVLLGLVKQRILWDEDQDSSLDVPMCRSADFQSGTPMMDPMVFPWERSKFNPADFPPESDGQVVLPCGNCFLKEWGSAADGKKPWCAEQFTIPLLVLGENGDTDNAFPALVTFQKTGLKAARTYMTFFKANKTPLYSVRTRLTLNVQKAGKNVWSTPSFARQAATDTQSWPEFSAQFRTMRDYLKQRRILEEQPTGDNITPNQWTQPANTPDPTPAPSPVVSPTVAASTTTLTPNPVVTPPAPPQPPAAVPVPPAAPVTQPPTTPTIPTPTPATPASPADDDLPF